MNVVRAALLAVLAAGALGFSSPAPSAEPDIHAARLTIDNKSIDSGMPESKEKA